MSLSLLWIIKNYIISDIPFLEKGINLKKYFLVYHYFSKKLDETQEELHKHPQSAYYTERRFTSSCKSSCSLSNCLANPTFTRAIDSNEGRT